MNIWPDEFQSVRVPGMSEIEGLALDMFSIEADEPNCPDCIRRWAWCSLCRLHCGEGDEHVAALLDAAIAKSAAEFKREAH